MKTIKKILLILIILVNSFLLVSCGAKDIYFTSSTNEINVGDPLNLSFGIEPDSSKAEEIRIVFDDDSFVKLSENDEYVATKEGVVTASIIYKDKIYDTKQFVIDPIPCKQIDADDFELGIGRKQNIEVRYYPDNCTHTDVSIVSGDETVAKVFGNEVTAISEGETTITIKSIDGPSKDIKVKVYPIIPEEITITGIREKYIVNDTDSLKISYKPDDVTNKEVKWFSSNSYVVSVDNNGKIVAKKPGTAIITAVYSDEIEYSKEIVVKYPPVSSLEINGSTNEIYEGNILRLYVSFTPDKVDDDTVVWSSEKENIAKVDNTGLVTGVSEGSVYIIAKTTNGKASSYKVTVEKKATTIPRETNTSGTMVWIPKTGSKYHYKSTCSNMKNPRQVTIEQAIDWGYEPCKKCAGG